jgi:hypothetical protein
LNPLHTSSSASLVRIASDLLNVISSCSNVDRFGSRRGNFTQTASKPQLRVELIPEPQLITPTMKSPTWHQEHKTKKKKKKSDSQHICEWLELENESVDGLSVNGRRDSFDRVRQFQNRRNESVGGEKNMDSLIWKFRKEMRKWETRKAFLQWIELWKKRSRQKGGSRESATWGLFPSVAIKKADLQDQYQAMESGCGVHWIECGSGRAARTRNETVPVKKFVHCDVYITAIILRQNPNRFNSWIDSKRLKSK